MHTAPPTRRQIAARRRWNQLQDRVLYDMDTHEVSIAAYGTTDRLASRAPLLYTSHLSGKVEMGLYGHIRLQELRAKRGVASVARRFPGGAA